ncbi:MAG: glycosyltransferase family 2 protein [Oscillospiraceae bacterium]|nr:glycosyltransferase family 2 protein [Oscillospiraceae bacterium]
MEYTQNPEKKLAEQEKTIQRQQAYIAQLEEQNRDLAESFDIISNSFFWKITKPFRFLLDVLKWLFRPREEKGLLRKGLYSLRMNGLRFTWHKALEKIYHADYAAKSAKRPLFSEEALDRQREHVFPERIKFSIAVPLYNTPELFLRAMIESVQAQTYQDWELCMADGSGAEHGDVERICREYMDQDARIRYRRLEKNLGISGNTNACMEMAEGDYIGLFDHDDLLHPAALYEVMRTIENTGADFIYTDESTFRDTPEDAYLPHFKPDFAPDNLRANNYICHFTVFKRALLDEAGWFDPTCDGSQDHDMILRLTEKAQRVAHIPEILYYWRAHAGSVAESPGVKPYVTAAGIRAVEKQLERLNLEGEVAPVQPGLTIYRTRYAVRGTPKVSILIPNYEHLKDLQSCLDSIFSKTTWPDYEIVIVENNSTSREIFSYYEALQKAHDNVRVVTWQGAFNFPAINNYGARFCTGEYLLLLNNDTRVISPDWIEEMLMFAQRPDVGAVGAMLDYPDNTIQHAGVCLGMGGIAGHFFQGADRHNLGYMGRLLYPQNVSAVTAACMLLRRDVWENVSGMDETWAVAFNDVDLCMRIRKTGLLIVWTPYAELYHDESKSRGSENTSEKRARFREEVRRFRERWENELESGDPYFNPNFSLTRSDYFVQYPLQPHDAR